MNPPSPHANNMATALRQAFGPGYMFGGPSDRQLEIIARNVSVANGGKRTGAGR